MGCFEDDFKDVGSIQNSASLRGKWLSDERGIGSSAAVKGNRKKEKRGAGGVAHLSSGNLDKPLEDGVF